MGQGKTRITNYLDSQDTRSTLDAVKSLGAKVDGMTSRTIADEIFVHGVGPRGPQDASINAGNASTLIRLLSGWLAGQSGTWDIWGDESTCRRPMDRIADPLRLMGGSILTTNGRPPLKIKGSVLRGISYSLPMPSAQVKSCLLLAGLSAEGATTVTENLSTRARDHTELMLQACGADIKIADDDVYRHITVNPAESIKPESFHVPVDFSSAAFFLAAAAIIPDSEIRLVDVGFNVTRTGLMSILRRMGASIEVTELDDLTGEPLAELVARHGSLVGTVVDASEVPAAIDELPLVALLGCFAEGETVVRGAEELRHKESDRIKAVVNGLRGLGADIEELEDGFVVRHSPLSGGVIDSHSDHRIAMIGALAGLASKEGVEVVDMEAAAVSYPRFEAHLGTLTSGLPALV